MANLWEWNWPSVAQECTEHLGPAGYGGVQVAPPQDSVQRQHLGDGSDTILHPWWEVYQAVDYALTSRMGDGPQFRSMVATCRRAGVKVYVDAVVNHATGQGDTSYGGQHYTHFTYPAAGWTYRSFHHKGGACPSASGGIDDFNNQRQVRSCELVGLADLNTGRGFVRDRLAAYLNKLIGYGVSGFRVDAAKHIGQPDLDAIRARLHDTRDGTRPYWALEVFGGGPGNLSPQAFTRSGDVLGLDGVKQLRDAFKSYPAAHTGSIATLKDFGSGSGLTPGNKTLSFVQNHDTERNGDALSYKDGATNTLATQYLLASGYGTPQVYSAFEFTTKDDSPPATADGMITDTECGVRWTCFDRDRGVRALVTWHNRVGSAARHDWHDDGGNLISFRRGRGWVAFNNDTAAAPLTVQTGLPRGRYCDLVTGRRSGGGCTGTTVVVGSSGRTTVTVPAKGAIAVTRP
jgi:alpha-amylase